VAVITVEGLDPSTGEVLEVECRDSVVAAVRRRGRSGDKTLPFVSPGLVDLQVNGYAGHDVNAENVAVDDLAAITEALANEGVTTWVPTIVTAPEDRIRKALRVVSEARGDPVLAAAIPFASVEGPFLSDLDGPRGVHDLASIRPIDCDEVERWAAEGPVGIVTVSPHWPNSARAISRIVASGITVAIGHTHADNADIRAAVDAGASLSTHLGNGIFPDLPRHPNPIWSQLAEDRLAAGFIADGHHLPAETLKVMLRAKPAGGAFVVSDATTIAGMPPGIYHTPVGGDVELSEDGRLSPVGTNILAGAAKSLAYALPFLIANVGLSVAQAVSLATSNPGGVVARVSGAVRGCVRIGGRADLVLIDHSGVVVGVVAGGKRRP